MSHRIPATPHLRRPPCYLFGFRGAALLAGATADDADPQRDSEACLAGSMP
jgi:hypothetical protein